MAIGSECVGHYLIWRMGIAHNDISLSNLMCTERNGHIVGILNDFDLAGFMEPGARNPEKMGWERTGSIAFMSMDVLKHPDGEQRRWYRHDLESFAWCLLWVMMDKPPLSWLDDGLDDVRVQKGDLFNNVFPVKSNIKSVWSFAKLFVCNWIQSLSETSIARNRMALQAAFVNDNDDEIEIYDSEDKKIQDPVHICLVLDAAKGMDGVADMPALRDTSWVVVVLGNLNAK